VGIFPEGKSHDLPAIEQVRTGAARVAAQAVNDGVTDLKIIPLGINYERKERFRSVVWVNIGAAIPAKMWLNDREERKGVRDLTAEIERRLKAVAIHLDEPDWEVMLEDLEALHPPPKDAPRDPLALLQQRKRIADAMNFFRAKDFQRTELVGDLLKSHHDGLEAAGLNIHSDFLHYHGILLVLRLLARGFLFLFSFALGVPGTLHHIVPFVITRGLARLVQAPGRSTIALSRLLIGLPVYVGWYYLAWRILAARFSPEVAWIWTVWMPSAGLFALMFWRQVKRVAPVLGRELAMLIRPEQIGKLRANQEKLKRELATLAAEFRQNRT
jgi:hypothetical protein